MRTPGPKVLAPLCGRPMLGYVLDQALALEPERVLLVTGAGGEAVEDFVRGAFPEAPIGFVRQAEQRGTGHAVMVCADELKRASGAVVVLYGDMPLLRAEHVAKLCELRADAGAAVMTATAENPRGFGRILRDGDGRLLGVVEEKDADEAQRAIREVNVGVYCFDRERLLERLPRLSTENAQGEYYLTDIVGMLVEEGEALPSLRLEDERETIGVNTIEHLSEARVGIQMRILSEHMARGVVIEDPATAYIDFGVEIGAGTHILPCTVIRGGVRIGEGCEVGPFTHLRVGTELADGAEVGNFTEAKKAFVGEGTKAKHLTYLGDVSIGKGANIGAGTIVANYDGTNKHHTDIGDRAFIGSGSILIAPSKVGEGALTGAGAVLTRGSEIPAGASWVGVPAHPIGAPKKDSKG